MLICPKCENGLEKKEGAFDCASCGASYEIADGIPVFVTSEEAGAGAFDEDYFEIDSAVEKKHFWFVGRNAILFRLYKKYSTPGTRMIELGCGAGAVLEYFGRRGCRIEGGDIFLSALRTARGNFPTEFWQVDVTRLPFDGEFDAAGLFDALEHVDDDARALAGIRRALKPGGLLFLAVPALPRLWSEHDDLLHHRRRYEKAPLCAMLNDAGFDVLKASFFNFLLYPAVRLSRALGRGRPRDAAARAEAYRRRMKIVPVLNGLFRAVMAIEALLIPRFNFPIGSSIVVVAKKR